MTDQEMRKIIRSLLNTEPYKSEFNTNYYRAMITGLLLKAMKAATEDKEPATATK